MLTRTEFLGPPPSGKIPLAKQEVDKWQTWKRFPPYETRPLSCIQNIESLRIVIAEKSVTNKKCDGRTHGRTDGRPAFLCPRSALQRGDNKFKIIQNIELLKNK